MSAFSCIAAAGSALLLTGCVNLAPHYVRPAAPVPTSWPDAKSASSTGASAVSNIGWQEFFQDPRLKHTIALTLANNRDLRVAILDIQKAQAEYRITRAGLFPAIDLSASQTGSHTPSSVGSSASSRLLSSSSSNTSTSSSRVDSASLGFSAYELDLFGRLRNLTSAAQESYLSTAETRRSTQITLVAEAAEAWVTLGADMRLLALAEQTFQSQQKTYALVQKIHALGGDTGLDLAQAEASLQAMRYDVATATTTVAQARNALNLLAGTTVPDVDLPDTTLEPLSRFTQLPLGVPSAVLEQRPDVLAAEHTLKADNADIGAARANFFPAISLTGAIGTISPALSGLFTGPNHSWSYEAAVSLPIFAGGANRATLDEAKVTQKIDIATYEKTIQTAFEEVSDALAIRATIADQLDAQNQTVSADQHAYDLSMELYRQGSYSLLDALTEQRLLYTAQQTQVTAQLAAQTSLLTLYKALGGGWYATNQAEAKQPT